MLGNTLITLTGTKFEKYKKSKISIFFCFSEARREAT